MKRYILVLVMCCLLPLPMFAQQTSDVTYDIKNTLRQFSTKLNNVDLATDGFKNYIAEFRQFGPQAEPTVFMNNGVRTGSITKWVETYVMDSLLCVDVNHTFDIIEGTLQKISSGDDGHLYSIDADLTWEYLNMNGEFIKKHCSVNFHVVWVRKGKWVQITQINGRWPALNNKGKSAIHIAEEYYNKKQYEKALEIYQLLADRDNAEAQYQLGSFRNSGNCGLNVDKEAAVTWYRKAAEQGHTDAQTSLGYCYAKGIGGLSKDSRKAAFWFKKAAVQGNVVAMSNLSIYYLEGNGGLPKDTLTAFMILHNCVKQPSYRASYNLGNLYETGFSILDKDLEKARVHYEQSAQYGYAPAYYRLGYFYEKGIGGLTRNPDKAIEYYTRSANQGDADAQYILGKYHYTGQCSLSVNQEEGLEWLNEAAKQNHPEAHYELSVHYNKQGGIQSILNKYKHFYLFCFYKYTWPTIVLSILLVGILILLGYFVQPKILEYLKKL